MCEACMLAVNAIPIAVCHSLALVHVGHAPRPFRISVTLLRVFTSLSLFGRVVKVVVVVSFPFILLFLPFCILFVSFRLNRPLLINSAKDTVRARCKKGSHQQRARTTTAPYLDTLKRRRGDYLVCFAAVLASARIEHFSCGSGSTVVELCPYSLISAPDATPQPTSPTRTRSRTRNSNSAPFRCAPSASLAPATDRIPRATSLLAPCPL